MLEQTNEIVRKVNSLAGKKVLSECQPLLSKSSRLQVLMAEQKYENHEQCD